MRTIVKRFEVWMAACAAGMVLIPCALAMELGILSPKVNNTYNEGDMVKCEVEVDWESSAKDDTVRTVILNANGRLYALTTLDGKTYTGFLNTKGIESDSLDLDIVASEANLLSTGVRLATNGASIPIKINPPYAVLFDSILDDSVELD